MEILMEEEMSMISGIIKSYSIEKETGFIEATDGKEYFFDISYLKNPKDKIEIKVGSPVVFTLNINFIYLFSSKRDCY